jgi:hypothetical protein
MAEDEGRPAEDGTENEDEEPDGTEDQDREDGGEEESDPAVLRAELTKAIRRRDRAIARAREAESRLRDKDSKDGKENEPDPVAEANARLVRAEAKGILAAAGVTDREDQAAVLDVLHLADIEVDSRGDVDTDAIEERVQRLREILGGAAKNGRPPRPRVDTRDRGRSGDSSADPDAARYKKFLGRR